MRKVLSFILMLIATMCVAQDKTSTFTLSSVDKALSQIALHARNYPPSFASAAERAQTEAELKRILIILDRAAETYPDDGQILFRDAFANAMGHNLDFPGCDKRAITGYEQLLKLYPNDKRANYYYGVFLASTTLVSKGIKYFQRAIELGEAEAHFGLAFAYLVLDEKQNAASEFRNYLKVDPNNKTAKQMLSDLENGTLNIRRRTMNGNEPPNPVIPSPSIAASANDTSR